MIGASLLSLAAACGLAFGAQPSDAAGSKRASIEIILPTEGVKPGSQSVVGVKFTISDGWHLYWNGQNDTGSSPTLQLSSSNPKVEFGSPRWPVPQRHVAAGDITDHIYERGFMVLVPISVPADLAPGSSMSLTINSKFLVCSNVCLPGEGTATLMVTAGTGVDGPGRTEISQAEKKMPEAFNAATAPFAAKFDGTALVITPKEAEALEAIAFFPADGCTEVNDLTAECASKRSGGALKPLRIGMTPNAKETGAIGLGIVECVSSAGAKRWIHVEVHPERAPGTPGVLGGDGPAVNLKPSSERSGRR
ncbi:MAG: protein-disulfide reductase DsbD family protein [Planctomycetota bacterium]|nr:protein-disulfide reductase DsbD family protein [Planctomycetota bacterium]